MIFTDNMFMCIPVLEKPANLKIQYLCLPSTTVIPVSDTIQLAAFISRSNFQAIFAIKGTLFITVSFDRCNIHTKG